MQILCRSYIRRHCTLLTFILHKMQLYYFIVHFHIWYESDFYAYSLWIRDIVIALWLGHMNILLHVLLVILMISVICYKSFVKICLDCWIKNILPNAARVCTTCFHIICAISFVPLRLLLLSVPCHKLHNLHYESEFSICGFLRKAVCSYYES